MIKRGRERSLSFARPNVMVSPFRSNFARKPLSGSVVTNKRGGLSDIFSCCIPLGASTVASDEASTGVGETGAGGLPGASIIVASKDPRIGIGETGTGGLPGGSIIVASVNPRTGVGETLAGNATGG